MWFPSLEEAFSPLEIFIRASSHWDRQRPSWPWVAIQVINLLGGDKDELGESMWQPRLSILLGSNGGHGANKVPLWGNTRMSSKWV
ncbi:hypothetical protein V6N13_023095 [Hibiscus sabdariffa]